MAEPRTDTVAVVLAAGRGERFGDQTKQLAEVDGRPLVAHAVAAAHAAGIERVVVVVGHAAAEVASAAAGGGPVEVVDNPDHAAGQATSLAAGIAAAATSAEADVAVVLLGDQPRVDPAAVRAVVGAVRSGAIAARARYLDGPGHPVAFARACWDRLLDVSGDAGARQLFDELEVVEVAIDAAVPGDVDTPADLDRLRGL